MKEELLKLYKEFLVAFEEKEKQIYSMGGVWSRKPNFEEFIAYLEKGYID